MDYEDLRDEFSDNNKYLKIHGHTKDIPGARAYRKF